MEQINMETKLINAVKRQLKSDNKKELLETLADVSNHGADAGFSGFTYYNETSTFFDKHRALILEHLNNEYSEIGYKSILEMIASFNCLKDCSQDEIARVLYKDTKNLDNNTVAVIKNGLAWYALESVAYHLSN
jgi:hypothetical protein